MMYVDAIISHTLSIVVQSVHDGVCSSFSRPAVCGMSLAPVHPIEEGDLVTTVMLIPLRKDNGRLRKYITRGLI
jgi:hypothetical protein